MARYVVALDTFVTFVDGVPRAFTKGQRVEADDPAVAVASGSFGPGVEQVSAAPGERRKAL